MHKEIQQIVFNKKEAKAITAINENYPIISVILFGALQ